MGTIKIRVKKDIAWAKKGEVHKVMNYVCFNWGDGKTPYFEKGKGIYGIKCEDCEILPLKEEIPEYTMQDLIEKLGHEFKLKRTEDK